MAEAIRKSKSYCLKSPYTARPNAPVNPTFDPGIGSFHAQAPGASTYIFDLDNDPAFFNSLTTTVADSNFFHDGAGTYIVRLGDSHLRVGNPLDDFPDENLDPVPADLYGFTLDMKGTFSDFGLCGSSVRVSRTIGYGPLQCIDACGIVVAGIGPEFFAPAGVIDCGFQLPPGQTPITASRWELDDVDIAGISSLVVVASKITQIGDWDFIPDPTGTQFTAAVITTNTLDTYPEGGQLQIHNSTLNIRDDTAPADPPVVPAATFAGSSQFIHTPGGFSRVFFEHYNQMTAGPSELNFLDASSVLRPIAYPTAPLPTFSLELHSTVGSTTVTVESKVAREALAFDAALADWVNKNTLTIENFAIDSCNVQFIDHLVPNGANPVTCLPKYNRCVKYWNNMGLTHPAPNVLVLRDDVDRNHEPTYAPADYPDEAVYFCDIDAGDGAGVTLNGLRLYARSADATVPEAVLLALTRYFDANADFDVDLMDFARFQNAFAKQGEVTWDPLADFWTDAEHPEADCDADIEDFKVVRTRWHTDHVPPMGEPQQYRVCTAANLPAVAAVNADNPNGDPTTIVCGGPLHVRPTTGSPPVPELDCPNCELEGLGCGTECDNSCPWVAGGSNPDGKFHIWVAERSSGAGCISVSGGAVVNYQIKGVLCDTANDGLALWGADLAMTGPASVTLNPATNPGSCTGGGAACSGIGCFNSPCGITNPAGYGGTQSGGGALLQIGGAQNTIKNTTGSFPLANPIAADVGFTEVVLAQGSVTMPSTAGLYTLRLSDAFANVIVDGEIAAAGEYFRTERVDIATARHLYIRVGLAAPVTITSANPPTDNPYIGGTQPYRDVLDTGDLAPLTHGIGGAGTPTQDAVTYSPISVTFSGTPNALPSTSNVTLHCSYTGTASNPTPCPTVTGVSGSGSGPYMITLSDPIPPGGCTTIQFGGSCSTLRYESLPGDTNMSGITNTQDLLDLVQAINNGDANLPGNLPRYDINRTPSLPTPVNTQDLLRLTQLLNGALTTQPWNQVQVAACDMIPTCADSGGESASSGGSSSVMSAGGGSEALVSGTDGGSGLSEQEQEDVIAAIEAACEEEAIESEECQAIIESLFGPQS